MFVIINVSVEFHFDPVHVFTWYIHVESCGHNSSRNLWVSSHIIIDNILWRSAWVLILLLPSTTGKSEPFRTCSAHKINVVKIMRTPNSSWTCLYVESWYNKWMYTQLWSDIGGLMCFPVRTNTNRGSHDDRAQFAVFSRDGWQTIKWDFVY